MPNIDIHKGSVLFLKLKLEKSKNYYVYCRSGARSAKACEVMNELGIENTFNLTGGILWNGDLVSP
jgi:rhodanese-related sulfurtransferase